MGVAWIVGDISRQSISPPQCQAFGALRQSGVSPMWGSPATSGAAGCAPPWQALAGQGSLAGSGAASAHGSASVARQSLYGAGQMRVCLATRTRAEITRPRRDDQSGGAAGEAPSV